MTEEERRARVVRREQFASATCKQFREAVVARRALLHSGPHPNIPDLTSTMLQAPMWATIGPSTLGALEGVFERRTLSGALGQPPPPNHMNTGRGWGAMPPPPGLMPLVTPQLNASAEGGGAQGAMSGSQLP